MQMYEELVKALRDMSIPCDGWKDLYAQAADAIEELQRELIDLKMKTCCCCEPPKEETDV